MKSPPSFKTRVALTCLLGGLLFYTCRPRFPELTANWKPAPAVAFFDSEAELRTWMGPHGFMEILIEDGNGSNSDLIEVFRQLEVHGLKPPEYLPVCNLSEKPMGVGYYDLSVFQRQGLKYRLIANLPFSWHARKTSCKSGFWIAQEYDWKIKGWKRIAEVRLDRTEPLIVSATE